MSDSRLSSSDVFTNYEPPKKKRKIETNLDDTLNDDDIKDKNDNNNYYYYNYNLISPNMILKTNKILFNDKNDINTYDGGNFIKDIKWSPNGYQFMSINNDKKVRIFNPFNNINSNDKILKSEIEYKINEPIYDIEWYPLINPNDITSNIFILNSRDNPIYLFDSYQNINNKPKYVYKYMSGDVCITSTALGFQPNGNNFISAHKNKKLIEFNTETGKYIESNKLINKSKVGVKGIISDIIFHNNNNDIFCVSSLNGKIMLFDRRIQYSIYILKQNIFSKNGITKILFSPCFNYILSGNRNGNHIQCWDIRNLAKLNKIFNNQFDVNNYDGNTNVLKYDKHVVCNYQRNVTNNQKITFDIDSYGKYIFSGTQNGCVNIFDTSNTSFDIKPEFTIKHDYNNVNCVQLSKKYPYLVTSTSKRILRKSQNYNILNDSESDIEINDTIYDNNYIYLWDLTEKK